jgi:hypothetical protein
MEQCKSVSALQLMLRSTGFNVIPSHRATLRQDCQFTRAKGTFLDLVTLNR